MQTYFLQVAAKTGLCLLVDDVHRADAASLEVLADLVARHADSRILIVAGLFGAALFFGDAMITPAISVLSASEGLKVISPDLESWVIPLTIGILIGLFAVQRHGTGTVGAFFGPVMMGWWEVKEKQETIELEASYVGAIEGGRFETAMRGRIDLNNGLARIEQARQVIENGNAVMSYTEFSMTLY